MYSNQQSHSPPSINNKASKNLKGSNHKQFKKLQQQQNQFTMYQPANINVPMTSQQSRRKSQASMNNMMTNSNQPAVGNLFNQKGHPMSIDPI